MIKSIVFILLIVSLTSCSKTQGFRSEHPAVYMAEQLPTDIKVPLKMWDMFKEKNEGFIFSEAKVWLKEKNSGVLVKDSIKIDLPKGGGTIDLADFTSSEMGSFYLGFDFADFENASMKKILFISRVKKRNIENKIWGLGCNKIIDITSKFTKAMLLEGLKLNTTKNRHLSVIGGTFILASTRDGQSFISQVTFKDSRVPDLFCSEVP